jgi:hypothetical protein
MSATFSFGPPFFYSCHDSCQNSFILAYFTCICLHRKLICGAQDL